ncbi:aldehyde dehydrogenase family protein [Streptomyces sp. NPDC001100]
MADDTEFGLSGAVHSSDTEHTPRVARRINSGAANLNNGITVDIGMPCGGVKQSGYGRELGPEGLDALRSGSVRPRVRSRKPAQIRPVNHTAAGDHVIVS